VTSLLSEKYQQMNHIKEAKRHAESVQQSMESLDEVLLTQKVETMREPKEEGVGSSVNSLDESIRAFEELLNDEKTDDPFKIEKLSYEDRNFSDVDEKLAYEDFEEFKQFKKQTKKIPETIESEVLKRKLKKRIKKAPIFIEKCRKKKKEIQEFKDMFLKSKESHNAESESAQSKKSKRQSRFKMFRSVDSSDSSDSFSRRSKKKILKKKKKKKRSLLEKMSDDGSSETRSPRFVRKFDDSAELMNAWQWEKKETEKMLKRSTELSQRFRKIGKNAPNY